MQGESVEHILHIRKGGAANHLCMPQDPDYLSYQSGVQGWNHVYGYDSYQRSLRPFYKYNVPCAVRYASTRMALPMI